MEALRQIPPVNDVLQAAELAGFRRVLGLPFAGAIIDSVFADVRRDLQQASNGAERPELTRKIAAEIARRLRHSLEPSLRRVINASGVILHTNLGRAPLPAGAMDHLREVSAGYSNLEFDLDTGKRGRRDIHAGRMLQLLLGCEAAIVVNNNAAAVLLVLNSLADGGEVVVSRGEEIEIGESFRIPDIISRSGARARETGATNRTRISDYEAAIGDETRLLLRVHPSNFRMIGFTERPSIEEFVQLGRRRHIPTYEDLGSGRLTDGGAGLADEPSLADSIRAGIDVVSFSGDKLLGGPQAGVIAGKKAYVDRIRKNPLFRALRVDKLTIAVLEYVLRAYLTGDLDAIPTCKMLREPEASLKARAEAFAGRAGPAVRPAPVKSVVGGGAAPEDYLNSWGVTLALPERSAAEIEERLRRSSPPVIARIENDRVILDFRTIAPQEEGELLSIVQQITR